MRLGTEVEFQEKCYGVVRS